jgi:inorganic pyrophosphatase
MTRRLDRLPLEDRETNEVTAVIETPRGSRNKYKYDGRSEALRLHAVLPEGLAFPHDFGFFPSTIGEDGDPLDVLVLLDSPVPAGCIVTVRLIGAIEVEQRDGESKGKGKSKGQSKRKGPWTRNDRFIAVGTSSADHAGIVALKELRPHLVEEIEAFLQHSITMAGKTLRITGRAGPRKARARLKTGQRAFRKIYRP